MRTVRRLVILSFFALVIGAAGGLLLDYLRGASETLSDPASDHDSLPERIPLPRPKTHGSEFAAKEIDCLANIVFREARNQSIGIQRLTAIVTIARRDDSDRQWPKTICEIMVQPRQISGVLDVIDISIPEFLQFGLIRDMAEEVYEGAWKTQLLPRGWECVRYWRASDEALRDASAKDLHQLGITEARKGLDFFLRLTAVPTPEGGVTFFKDDRRCVTKLPTT